MITSYAPGRVNLIGEHTDYTGGYVLPMAVDMGVTCSLSPRPDGVLAVTSREMHGRPILARIRDLGPEAAEGWSAYVLGTAWALREWGVPVKGADIHLKSNLPAGAGLSSSAAVECAVALALLAEAGVELPPREVARVAKKAENEFVGAPTGSMDQVASMLGQQDALLFFDTGRDTTRAVQFPLAAHNYHLLVIDTHVHHHLVTDEYGERRRALEAATSALGVHSLRDVVDPAMVETLADPVLRRRARHVVTENARVLAVIELLDAGRLPDVGPLLVAGHNSLRDDLEVSCIELDITVEAALHGGAVGARMVGGGFGGSAIALVPASHVGDVESTVGHAYESRGWKAPNFYDVTPAQGARLLR